ncbi:MAG: AraC family transcriptional regulator [Bacteroidales bacterium]|nr:AraC family transcriptional regulator [Bacteroidales bacterium]
MNMINIPKFKLIGLKLGNKTTNENGQSGIDCGNLWQKFETENFAERIQNKVSSEIYAVYYNYDGDYTKPFSYFIGCKVKNNSEIPHGMDSLVIPAGNYSKVIAKGKMPDCITNSWKKIWSSNIARTYQFDFEIYDERSKDWSNAEVDIFVSCN